MEIVKTKDGRYSLPNGGYLSSPSRILRPLTIGKYKDIPQWIMSMAQEFGREAHENIETYEKLGADDFAKEQVEDCLHSIKHQNVFNQYLQWKKDFNVKVLETEKLVYSTGFRYFGYIDAIVEIDGEKYIVDYKTRANLKSDDNFMVETLQLLLYQIAYLEMTGEHIDVGLLIINKTTKTKRTFKQGLKYISKDTLEKYLNALNDLLNANKSIIELRENIEREKNEN